MNPAAFPLSSYNPLRALDDTQLIALLDEGERGAYAALQWLFRYLEKRDPIGRAVKSRLLAAIGKLDWQVTAPDCGDDAEKQAAADAQAETLRAAYDQIVNLQDSINFLALAELRGFSHLEKIYAGGSATLTQGQGGNDADAAAQDATLDPWAIVELRIVEQWFWVRCGVYGAWQYNQRAAMGVNTGTEVDPARFVIREIDGPIGEIMAKLYVAKNASDADWDGALQTFGVPPVIIEMPPNIPPEKEKEYQRQAENIASGAKGTIPAGAKVHTVNPLSGSGVFKERLEYLEAQLVIAATGGKLTILTESGSGTLAGGAQADAFDDLADAIAMRIGGTFNEQLDREILARKHKGEPPLAYFQLSRTTEKDGSKALGDAKLAKDAGFALDADELQERSGYKLTVAGAPPVQTSPPNETEAQTPASNGDAAPGAQKGATLPASPGLPPDASKTAAMPTAIPASPSALPAPTTPAELQAATASALGVSPEYLAPAAQEFGTLLAQAADGALTADDFLAAATAMIDQLPALAEKMDTTAIADALTQATRKAVAATLQP